MLFLHLHKQKRYKHTDPLESRTFQFNSIPDNPQNEEYFKTILHLT